MEVYSEAIYIPNSPISFGSKNPFQMHVQEIILLTECLCVSVCVPILDANQENMWISNLKCETDFLRYSYFSPEMAEVSRVIFICVRISFFLQPHKWHTFLDFFCFSNFNHHIPEIFRIVVS